jgi:hypothetical protein
VPGEGEAQKANAAKKDELQKQVREGTYVTNLRLSGGVKVHPYNAKKKTTTIEIDGLVECTDALGMVSLAWGEPAKPFRPPGGGGDDDDEALTPQSVWRARPLLIKLPFATKAEAAKFAEGPGTLLEARLVYTLGKPDQDKHVVKTSRLAQEDGTRPGEDEMGPTTRRSRCSRSCTSRRGLSSVAVERGNGAAYDRDDGDPTDG